MLVSKKKTNTKFIYTNLLIKNIGLKNTKKKTIVKARNSELHKYFFNISQGTSLFNSILYRKKIILKKFQKNLSKNVLKTILKKKIENKKRINNLDFYFNFQFSHQTNFFFRKILNILVFSYIKEHASNNNAFFKRIDFLSIKQLYCFLNKKKQFYTFTELKIQRKILNFLFQNWDKFKNPEIIFFFKKFLISNLRKYFSLNTGKKKIFAIKSDIFYFKLKPSFNNIKEVYKKLTGLIIKNGNKNLALKIISKSLSLASKEFKIPLNLILLKIYNRLKMSIEFKKVKIRRSTHIVPFPVNFKRKTYLIAKWILNSIEGQKIKKSTIFKLCSEFLKILKIEKSLSLKRKDYIIYKSLQNRSNSHFRW